MTMPDLPFGSWQAPVDQGCQTIANGAIARCLRLVVFQDSGVHVTLSLDRSVPAFPTGGRAQRRPPATTGSAIRDPVAPPVTIDKLALPAAATGSKMS